MKAVLTSRLHLPTGKATTFLLVVALIASLAGCTEVHDLPDNPARYALTISSTEGGSVTAPGQGTFQYDSGETVSLLAEPEQGYRFVNWTGNVGGIEDVGAPSTNITMTSDHSITASFEPLSAAQCDLTISSSAGGSVTAPGEGTFGYETDTVVELVAAPSSGYRFVNWTGDTGTVADIHAASTTITVDGAMTLTANFAVIGYDLTVGSSIGGSVTVPGKGTFTYDPGIVVDLVVEPAQRYRFAGWTGDVSAVGDPNAASTTVTMNGNYSISAVFEVMTMVTAGIWHTVGLKTDGTVIAVGSNTWGQSEVGGWTDIIQVAAGERHTVGLRSDGTVVAVGSNEDGQLNVDSWTDIVQIDCGRYYTVGLRSDGTVLAVGGDLSGQLGVGGWTGIVQVATGFYHTLGLKGDGTVVAVGNSGEGRLEVADWTNVVQLGAGGHHSLGLRSDGTVLAVGRNNYGETQVDQWIDIVQVAGGCQASVGLRSDGIAVHAGWCTYGQCLVGGWSGIIQVDAGIVHAVGLKADGTVVAVGSNGSGQCDVDEWMLGSAAG